MSARKIIATAMLTALGMAGLATTPAAAADGLLPHPGPEGLVWVEEMTGDGGVASGGAWEKAPTVLTVACEGGGSVAVKMESQQRQVADFTVDCPTGTAGVGSVTMDAGVVQSGSFTIRVDASDEHIRWSLTVTQPE
ncbi:hypothetical protein [Streptomyces sp. MA5143a]|uniref:hypothetical protein n=1 Tax=Streptomyces sp. MA5143a TaxID=2083010 RepID=UPI000D26B5D2|nr:hypothetical protein [Streptomyces sp. MA5143a]SPF06377.1 hypothetical protein SMA5143A_7205 [Streptomyces sp. MA5143a]